jgi:hypothetical protein
MLIGTNNGQRMLRHLGDIRRDPSRLIGSAISPPIAGRSNSKAVGGLSVPTALP